MFNVGPAFFGNNVPAIKRYNNVVTWETYDGPFSEITDPSHVSNTTETLPLEILSENESGGSSAVLPNTPIIRASQVAVFNFDLTGSLDVVLPLSMTVEVDLLSPGPDTPSPRFSVSLLQLSDYIFQATVTNLNSSDPYPIGYLADGFEYTQSDAVGLFNQNGFAITDSGNP